MNWKGTTKEGYPRVLLATPALDFRVDVQNISGLIAVLAASSGGVQPYWICGNSNIADARNKIAHYFMRHTPCETLVAVDSDIVYTLKDFEFLMEGDEEIVIGEYARKVVGKPPVDFGMGFVRINRSVFQNLADWTCEAPPDETPGQVDSLNRYMMDGELAVDFFYTGATRDSRWLGEDTGFFHWCAMRDIKTRKETRTRLGHVGRFVYGYPDQTPGLIPIESGAQ